jgi:hypothetical protein
MLIVFGFRNNQLGNYGLQAPPPQAGMPSA